MLLTCTLIILIKIECKFCQKKKMSVNNQVGGGC